MCVRFVFEVELVKDSYCSTNTVSKDFKASSAVRALLLFGVIPCIHPIRRRTEDFVRAKSAQTAHFTASSLAHDDDV